MWTPHLWTPHLLPRAVKNSNLRNHFFLASIVPMFSKDKKTVAAKTSPAEQWVDLYGDYLYRFALGRLRQPDLAKNVVQETFLAALTARKNFSGRSSERTWLIGILKHKIIDHLRHKYREVVATDLNEDQKAIDNFFDEAGHPFKYPSGWLPNPRELSQNHEFWLVLERCLKKLPEKTAHAFTLREFDEMETRDICKILKISATNLWVMLHRARIQLRECLEINWFEKEASTF